MTMETKDIVDALTERGYVILPRAVQMTLLDVLRAEADLLIEGFTAHGYRSEDFWSYDDPDQGTPILYRIHNLERQSAATIASLYETGCVHDIAHRILGPSRPTAHAMVVKTPGAAGVPWHRDRTNVGPFAAINLSIYVDRATGDNGCLEVVPGSHKLPDDADVEAVRAHGPRVLLPAEPGDVVVHDVRLVHGSGGNDGGALRRSIITEFVAEPGDAARCADRQ